MNLNVNLFTLPRSISEVAVQTAEARGMVECPNCGLEAAPAVTEKGWQVCSGCDNRLQIRMWPVAPQRANQATALQDQATCFFHPDKAFQACCQRCGRFVCALCDLQLGAEHVCPTCFERGRADAGLNSSKAEWRDRDVLYDSIALVLGLGWIIVWPVILAAIPAAIVLHVKYRKAPRSYLIPRSGWRFWVAYVGFVWLPLLIVISLSVRSITGRH